MKKLATLFYFGLLAIAATSCKHDSDVLPIDDSVVGSWRLTKMPCFCAFDPKVVEVLTLDGNQQFRLVRDGVLASQGSYAVTQGAACNSGPLAPYLKLTVATPNTYAPNGEYTVQNNTLTITGCVALDGPAYVYERQP
ncbi:MAG: hypothetical protein EOO57_10815 [Hymenobacter sp.]|nr:MAG: hypothetical protein EOO57_10815 [Hymenobacter sp.]